MPQDFYCHLDVKKPQEKLLYFKDFTHVRRHKGKERFVKFFYLCVIPGSCSVTIPEELLSVVKLAAICYYGK